MNSYDWLQELQPGDKVLQPVGWGGFRIMTVERTTKTQVVLEGVNQKYSKRNGDAVGCNRYSRNYIQQATPEKLEKLALEERDYKASAYIKDLDVKPLTLEQKEEVVAMVKGMLYDQ